MAIETASATQILPPESESSLLRSQAIDYINELIGQDDRAERLKDVLEILEIELMENNSLIEEKFHRIIDLSKNGTQTLDKAYLYTERIEQDNAKIDKQCLELQEIAEDNELLGNVSAIYNFCNSVKSIVAGLSTIEEEIRQISSMFDESEQSQDMNEPLLLPIHFKLQKLNRFRDHVFDQARNSDLEVKSTLSVYFEGLDTLNLRFEDLLVEICKNILFLAQQNARSLIVRIAKIIYKEEMNDAQICAYREYLKEIAKEKIYKTQNWLYYSGTLQRYKQKFNSAIQQSIREKFSEAKTHFEGDYFLFLKKSKWIFADLDLIKKIVIPCFPKEWNFLHFYANSAHSQLNMFLDEFLLTDPDTASSLELLNWITQYYLRMETEFQLKREDLVPPLLGGDESSLISDYTKVMVEKLMNWTQTIRKDDIEVFLERTREPELVNSIYTFPGTGTLFQIIDQQISLAESTKLKNVLPKLYEEICKMLEIHLDKWLSVLSQEAQKFQSNAQLTCSGLLEYIITLGNHLYQCCEYINKLLSVEDTIGEEIKLELKRLLDRYTDAIDECVQHMVKHFERDVNHVYGEFFTSEWYEKDIMGSIVETFKEYYEILISRSVSFLVLRFVDHWFRNFFKHYILAACAKGTVFKLELTIKRIGKDFEPLIKFVQKNIEQEMVVFEGFKVIDLLIINLLECTSVLDFQEYISKLFAEYPDIPQQLVIDLVSKQRSLKKAQQKECIDILKSNNILEEKTTFFSNLFKSNS